MKKIIISILLTAFCSVSFAITGSDDKKDVAQNRIAAQLSMNMYLHSVLSQTREFDFVVSGNVKYFFGTVELNIDKLNPYQLEYLKYVLYQGKVSITGPDYDLEGVTWRITSGLNYPRFANNLNPSLFDVKQYGVKSFFTDSYFIVKRRSSRRADMMEEKRQALSKLEVDQVIQRAINVKTCSMLFER